MDPGVRVWHSTQARSAPGIDTLPKRNNNEGPSEVARSIDEGALGLEFAS